MNLERHVHITEDEMRGILALSVFSQALMGIGLFYSLHQPILWGTWFLLSAAASAWYALVPSSNRALRLSGIGVVLGCAARALHILAYHPGPIVVLLARASVYALAAGLAFIVWVGVLAPCNGMVRAEKRGQ